MKFKISILTILAISLLYVFNSCNKNSDTKTNYETELKGLEADLTFLGSGDFEKVITKPLVITEACKYITSGTIEFYKNSELIAIIDFGDGTCDNIASKTIGDKIIEFSLDKSTDEKSDYKKVVVEPLVKLENCDFIVSGIIKFYHGDKWIVTINFGDGTCDEWATKTWDGGSKVFSLKK